jgi:hypothetical protein
MPVLQCDCIHIVLVNGNYLLVNIPAITDFHSNLWYKHSVFQFPRFYDWLVPFTPLTKSPDPWSWPVVQYELVIHAATIQLNGFLKGRCH